jgi:long-subunit acyl-CoA synthetase (AMP-forming)
MGSVYFWPGSPKSHNNSTEWTVCAFAAYGLDARYIPMYEKELPRIWRYIINDGKVRLLQEDFSLENGTLTQTMKLKRLSVWEQYQDQLEALYS